MERCHGDNQREMREGETGKTRQGRERDGGERGIVREAESWSQGRETLVRAARARVTCRTMCFAQPLCPARAQCPGQQCSPVRAVPRTTVQPCARAVTRAAVQRAAVQPTVPR